MVQEFRSPERRLIYSPYILSSFYYDVGLVSITSQTMPENCHHVMPLLAKIVSEMSRGEIDPITLLIAEKQALMARPNNREIPHVVPEDIIKITQDMLLKKPALVTIGDAKGIHTLDEFWEMLQNELHRMPENENSPQQSMA